MYGHSYAYNIVEYIIYESRKYYSDVIAKLVKMSSQSEEVYGVAI